MVNVDVPRVCSCMITPYYSLRGSNVTVTGAIALARALQQNKLLEELK